MIDTLARLERAGLARRKARAAEAKATAEIASLVGPARSEGLTVAQIMAATGLSRQGVYDLLRR